MKSTYLILNWLSVLIGSPILIAFVWFITGSVKVDIASGMEIAGGGL